MALKKVISDSGLKLLHGAMREKDLGIPIGDDVTAEEIYEPMIARIAKAIARFKRFKLSIAGRVLVAGSHLHAVRPLVCRAALRRASVRAGQS